MIFTNATAKELVNKLANEGQTIKDDDYSFDKTLRFIQYGPWVLIVTTANTLSLFENGAVCFTVQVKDTAYDVGDLLVLAYERKDQLDIFEYL
jgi:hypothetical protein